VNVLFFLSKMKRKIENKVNFVKELAKECLESVKNYNNIPSLLECCTDEEPRIAFVAILNLTEIFQKLEKIGKMDKSQGNNEKVSIWLREMRNVFLETL
jgi:hypothetical protein